MLTRKLFSISLLVLVSNAYACPYSAEQIDSARVNLHHAASAVHANSLNSSTFLNMQIMRSQVNTIKNACPDYAGVFQSEEMYAQLAQNRRNQNMALYTDTMNMANEIMMNAFD